MTIEFEDLEYTTDKGKAIPKLEHKFIPLEDNPELVITCEYFQAGEQANYVNVRDKKNVQACFRDIFADKVKRIEGFNVKDKKSGKVVAIEDPKEFLRYPGSFCYEIIQLVAAHLVTCDGLNEQEVKN